MWGRLKRRILRSKAGGVYNASHDDEFSDSRDTYRDFREELYDDSRGSGSWKEGGKSGKRMSLTKTPFPNLDRCSCGTPGGRDLQENVAKSETLRRKNDFILGGDGKSCNQTKGRIIGKAKNVYTSTSTGPGTRSRTVDGGEPRLRASTSTGQIPCSPESEEQAKNEWNSHRRNGHSPGAPPRRLAYTDDELEDDDDESEEEEEEEDEEEDSADGGEDARVPSTSQPFRNSSQSEGTKSSSNSSDYTSLAFDLNYVKVSPPKLRRRRKKNADKNSAPLMVRRERRLFPETSSSSDRLPPRAVESKRPVGESRNLDETTTSALVRLDGVDAGLPRRSSKDGGVPAQLESDASCRQPAVLLSPITATKQRLSSGYVAWADIHNPPGVISKEDSRDICKVSGSDRTEERVEEERVPERGCQISTSGSVLQFTFTVRLDNDVIRGTRRDVERPSGAVAGSGSSLLSGRLDILNQEKPGGGASVPGRGNVINQEKQQLHQQACIPGSESMSLVQRSFKVQLQEEGAPAQTQNVTSSQETRKESSNVVTDPSDGFKDQTPSVSQQQVVHTAGGNGLDGSPKTRNVALGVVGRQRTLEDIVSNQGTRMTTVAIVHKSASDHGDQEETNVVLSRNELGPTDGRADYFQTGDPVLEAKSGPRKAFDEVDSCIANSSKSHQCPPSSPPPGSSAPEDGSELTHMSWDEVMKEAQSLGIPLSRPSQQPGSCDKARQSTSTDQQILCSSGSPPLKHGGASFPDVYWVCSSCTEAMQHQSSSSPAARKTPSKTSSPFKEKFKLQSIFGGSGGGAGGGGGGKKPKEERTCKGQATSSPLSRKVQSPAGGAKYTTMPIPIVASTTKDVVLWGGQNCTCRTSRSLQTSRQRSLSPVSSTRCSQAVQSSPRAAGIWGRGGDKRGQRISHLCSPPLLRCRFSSHGRTMQSASQSPSLKKSAHLSSEMLTSSSSPVIRRANDNDRDFLKSLAQLMGCSWYWGTLSFEAAEAELMDRPDGAFLVRDSSDDRYILSVSFRSQRSTHHVRIERHNGLFSFSAEHGLHESPDIVDFVENAMELSQSGQCLYYLRPRQLNAAPVPVQLIYPVSRFAH